MEPCICFWSLPACTAKTFCRDTLLMLHWEPWDSHYSTGQGKTKKVTENCLPLLSFVCSFSCWGGLYSMLGSTSGRIWTTTSVSLALLEVVSCWGSGNPCAGKLVSFLVAKISDISWVWWYTFIIWVLQRLGSIATNWGQLGYNVKLLEFSPSPNNNKS